MLGLSELSALVRILSVAATALRAGACPRRCRHRHADAGAAATGRGALRRGVVARGPGVARTVWGSVTGAWLWYVLHGYTVEAPAPRRRSIGHGRVVPPRQRRLEAARPLARQLTVKAARRPRRAGVVARRPRDEPRAAQCP